MRPHPRIVRWLLLIVVPLALVLGAGAIWLRGGRTVGTENAYVKAHIAQVAPEISGRVAEVLVRDHMKVKPGQLLVRIDPAPFPLALDKAQAALDPARIKVETAAAAPLDGTGVAVELQPGDPLKVATPFFVVVADTRPWVEANLKETDLTHVSIGQKATVVLDIYPDAPWDAEIESISPASGAEFAILPPQNASGNWVKVVQRLPVRMRLLRHDGEPPLRAGMTATVTIDIGRQRNLTDVFPGAAARPRPAP